MPWADTVFEDWDDCVWQDWEDCESDKFSIAYQDPKTRTIRQFVEGQVQNLEPLGGQRQLRNVRIGRQPEYEWRWVRYLDDTRWEPTCGVESWFDNRWLEVAGVASTITWDDDYSDDTIDQNESDVPIGVEATVGPYTWTVSGTGFSLGAAETAGPTNTLDANGSACGPATITVTDACNGSVTGYVRATTGTWDRKEIGYACGFEGGCSFYQASAEADCAITKEIITDNTKWILLGAEGTCAYRDNGCTMADVDWDLQNDNTCNDPPTYPPSCGSPTVCNTGTCDGFWGDLEVGCVYRKYEYYEWECA